MEQKLSITPHITIINGTGNTNITINNIINPAGSQLHEISSIQSLMACMKTGSREDQKYIDRILQSLMVSFTITISKHRIFYKVFFKWFSKCFNTVTNYNKSIGNMRVVIVNEHNDHQSKIHMHKYILLDTIANTLLDKQIRKRFYDASQIPESILVALSSYPQYTHNIIKLIFNDTASKYILESSIYMNGVGFISKPKESDINNIELNSSQAHIKKEEYNSMSMMNTVVDLTRLEKLKASLPRIDKILKTIGYNHIPDFTTKRNGTKLSHKNMIDRMLPEKETCQILSFLYLQMCKAYTYKYHLSVLVCLQQESEKSINRRLLWTFFLSMVFHDITLEELQDKVFVEFWNRYKKILIVLSTFASDCRTFLMGITEPKFYSELNPKILYVDFNKCARVRKDITDMKMRRYVVVDYWSYTFTHPLPVTLLMELLVHEGGHLKSVRHLKVFINKHKNEKRRWIALEFPAHITYLQCLMTMGMLRQQYNRSKLCKFHGDFFDRTTVIHGSSRVYIIISHTDLYIFQLFMLSEVRLPQYKYFHSIAHIYNGFVDHNMGINVNNIAFYGFLKYLASLVDGSTYTANHILLPDHKKFSVYRLIGGFLHLWPTVNDIEKNIRKFYNKSEGFVFTDQPGVAVFIRSFLQILENHYITQGMYRTLLSLADRNKNKYKDEKIPEKILKIIASVIYNCGSVDPEVDIVSIHHPIEINSEFVKWWTNTNSNGVIKVPGHIALYSICLMEDIPKVLARDLLCGIYTMRQSTRKKEKLSHNIPPAWRKGMYHIKKHIKQFTYYQDRFIGNSPTSKQLFEMTKDRMEYYGMSISKEKENEYSSFYKEYVRVQYRQKKNEEIYDQTHPNSFISSLLKVVSILEYLSYYKQKSGKKQSVRTDREYIVTNSGKQYQKQIREMLGSNHVDYFDLLSCNSKTGITIPLDHCSITNQPVCYPNAFPIYKIPIGNTSSHNKGMGFKNLKTGNIRNSNISQPTTANHRFNVNIHTLLVNTMLNNKYLEESCCYDTYYDHQSIGKYYANIPNEYRYVIQISNSILLVGGNTKLIEKPTNNTITEHENNSIEFTPVQKVNEEEEEEGEEEFIELPLEFADNVSHVKDNGDNEEEDYNTTEFRLNPKMVNFIEEPIIHNTNSPNDIQQEINIINPSKLDQENYEQVEDLQWNLIEDNEEEQLNEKQTLIEGVINNNQSWDKFRRLAIQKRKLYKERLAYQQTKYQNNINNLNNQLIEEFNSISANVQKKREKFGKRKYDEISNEQISKCKSRKLGVGESPQMNQKINIELPESKLSSMNHMFEPVNDIMFEDFWTENHIQN